MYFLLLTNSILQKIYFTKSNLIRIEIIFIVNCNKCYTFKEEIKQPNKFINSANEQSKSPYLHHHSHSFRICI